MLQCPAETSPRSALGLMLTSGVCFRAAWRRVLVLRGPVTEGIASSSRLTHWELLAVTERVRARRVCIGKRKCLRCCTTGGMDTGTRTLNSFAVAARSLAQAAIMANTRAALDALTHALAIRLSWKAALGRCSSELSLAALTPWQSHGVLGGFFGLEQWRQDSVKQGRVYL